MAFDSLTEKLQNVFKNLRSKGRLTEEDVKAALKEVKMALLEADVNFKVVKDFIKTIQERAVGQDVMNSLTPGQMVVKLVNEELVSLMVVKQQRLNLNLPVKFQLYLCVACRVQEKLPLQPRLQESLNQRGADRCLLDVIFTVQQL